MDANIIFSRKCTAIICASYVFFWQSCELATWDVWIRYANWQYLELWSTYTCTLWPVGMPLEVFTALGLAADYLFGRTRGCSWTEFDWLLVFVGPLTMAPADFGMLVTPVSTPVCICMPDPNGMILDGSLFKLHLISSLREWQDRFECFGRIDNVG